MYMTFVALIASLIVAVAIYERRRFGMALSGHCVLTLMALIFFPPYLIAPSWSYEGWATPDTLSLAFELLLLSVFITISVKLLFDFLFSYRNVAAPAVPPDASVYARPGFRLLVAAVVLLSLITVVLAAAYGRLFDPTILIQSASGLEYRSFREGNKNLPAALAFFQGNFSRIGVLPLFIIVTLAQAVRSKVLGRYWLVAVAVVTYAYILPGHKSRILYALVALTLAAGTYFLPSFLLRVRKAINPLTIILGLTVMCAILAYLYMGQYSLVGLGFWEGFLAAIYRMTFELWKIFVLYVQFIPTYFPHAEGGTSGLLASLLGVEPFAPMEEIPRALGQYTSTMPTYFPADGWADFGVMGIIGVSAIFGLYLGIVNFLEIRIRHRPESFAFFFVASLGGAYFLQLNLITAFGLGGGASVILIGVYLWKITAPAVRSAGTRPLLAPAE